MTQPNEAPPHFLVFVPGYMGSQLRSRKTGDLIWIDLKPVLSNPFRLKQSLARIFDQMAYPNPDLQPAGIVDSVVFAPPLFKQEQYGRMVLALQKMGYELEPEQPSSSHPALYTFDYDWRQDNRISARQLGQRIDDLRARHPGAKAWILGHSNGGILSRWYIEKEGGKDFTGRLFLLGSPWDGAPKSLQVFVEGMQVMFMALFNRLGMPELTRRTIRSFPSYYQLLPWSRPFLRTDDNQPFDVFTDPAWLETDAERAMLADAKKFNEDLGSTLSVETYCFYGNRKETTTGGIVHLLAGRKIDKIDWDRTEAGDGTVPMRSGIHPFAKEKLPYQVGHGDIYVNVDVLEKLEFELVKKYELGLLSSLKTSRLTVQFEPQGDVFAPGEEIPVWATITLNATGKGVSDGEVAVRLEWSQELPGFEGSAAPDLSNAPAIRLKGVGRGCYQGRLTAPDSPGYYRLAAVVTVKGEEPLSLEELVLVEPPIELPEEALAAEAGSEAETAAAGGAEEAAPAGRDIAEDDTDDIFDEIDLERDERKNFNREPVAESPGPGWTAGGPPPATEPAWPQSGGSSGEAPGGGAGAPAPGGAAWAAGISFTAPVAREVAADAPAGAQADTRFLNAELLGADPDQPLQKDDVYTLAFGVDVLQGRASTAFDSSLAFTEEEALVDLDVVVVSSDFNLLSPETQRLRIPKTGKSRNKAQFQFEVKPTAGETGVLNAYFQKGGNFVQGMKLTFNIGGQGKPAIAAVEKRGRPKFGAVAVQPRNVSLTIDTNGSNFSLLLKDTGFMTGTLHYTLEELDRTIGEARQALRQALDLEDKDGNLPYQSGIDIPDEVHQQALLKLAQAGWDLFNDIFFNHGDKGAMEIGARLRLLAARSTLKFQVVSGKFLIPWGLLYLAEEYPEESADPAKFLGMCHIIEHIPTSLENAPLSLEIASQPALAVSLNLNYDLDRSDKSRVTPQSNYWKGLVAQGVKVTEGQAGKDLLAALAAKDNPPQIIYFYCHAASGTLEDDLGADSANLRLTGDEVVTLRDLKRKSPQSQLLPGAPLVFINACQSAETSPLYYGGFVTYFTAKGARGVIGTECEVPAVFAMRWAERFFDCFLSGERPLGDVFLGLRQEFLDEHNNLLGLLYAVYCDGDTLVRPGL